MSLLKNQRLLLAASILLALGFAVSGVAKIVRLDFELEAFDKFGLPTWLMVQVGIAEVVAALLLLRASTASLGAIIGVAIMCVAIPAHLVAGEVPQAVVPLLFLAGFLFVGWARREHLPR